MQKITMRFEDQPPILEKQSEKEQMAMQRHQMAAGSSNLEIREHYLYHIRWIFGKLPNGLWPQPPPPPHPIFGKKCCAFVREIGARSAFPLPKKRNIIFRIGNDPPPFRKFSENSSNLVQVMLPKREVQFLCRSKALWSMINNDGQVKVVFMLGLAGEDSNEDLEQEEERNRWWKSSSSLGYFSKN